MMASNEHHPSTIRCGLSSLRAYRHSIVVAMLISLWGVSPSQSQDRSASFLLPACEGAATNTGRASFLQGYCTGLIDGLATFETLKMYCPPERATNGQRLQVVTAYIEAHPELMDKDIRDLAIDAMKAAWPCK